MVFKKKEAREKTYTFFLLQLYAKLLLFFFFLPQIKRIKKIFFIILVNIFNP